jgi:hypothetical protein
MTHLLWSITRILLAIAWLLLVIGMFLSQVQIIYHGQNWETHNGFFVTGAAFFFGLIFLLSFVLEQRLIKQTRET